jgi:hypothetical protein
LRVTLLSCFAKRTRWGKLPIAASTLSAGASDATLDLKPPPTPRTAGRVGDPRTPARDKQRRVQPRCPRPTDQLSPASPAHRRGRAAPSPLLRASARHRRRARDGASAAGLANASKAWRTRARTTRHARTRPLCPCLHNEARPHLQRCDCGVDAPGAGDDGPPAAGEGGTCCLRTSCRAS